MSRKWSIWSLDRVWDRKSFSGRLHSSTHSLCAFQVAHWVKESAWNARNTGRHKFDPWVGKMPWGRKWQSHSSVLAWEIPWTEEPGGLQSMGLHRVRNNWSNVHTHTFSLLLRTNSIFLEEPTVSHAQLTGFMEADLTPLLEQCASTWWESRRADPKTSAGICLWTGIVRRTDLKLSWQHNPCWDHTWEPAWDRTTEKKVKYKTEVTPSSK